jgi:hypothetical protein
VPVLSGDSIDPFSISGLASSKHEKANVDAASAAMSLKIFFIALEFTR